MIHRLSSVSRHTAIRLPLLLLMFASCAMAGGIPIPPNVHWIGPEANCDYPTIQDALDEVFDCGVIFPCPQGRNELHLSLNYDHSGQVVVDRTFDITGGFSSCKGPFNPSLQSNLSTGQGGVPLFIIRPGNRSINNVFRNLRMFGNSSPSPRGDVINMESGNATLTLRDSLAANGFATFGGAIALAGNGNRLVIENSRITSSNALEGGGIGCTGGGVVDFKSGFIEDNTAQLSGGGIYLQAGCQLIGKSINRDRQIRNNRVTDHQSGEGGGVYAIASSIDVGAIRSRTIFEANIVEALPPLHNYDLPGDNRGGGVHVDGGHASFINTWFRGNEAADGGAISATGNAKVLVDRTSGPCHSTDSGNSNDCSLFEYNRARGGTDSDGDEGGDGAALLLSKSFGLSPSVSINRSTWRFNAASCYEADNPPTLTGECDVENGSPGTDSDTSIIHGLGGELSALSLRGNLLYQNDIGDDEDCSFPTCIKSGVHIRYAGLLEENTSAQNSDADHFLVNIFNNMAGDAKIVNNIIREPDSDEFGEYPELASCNVSNFAAEMNARANSVPVSNRDLDPQFLNPVNEDFRVTLPISPAIDRCDDAEGLATLTYDIVGTPRPLNIGGVSNGPGQRDVGAFEAVSDGYINNTVDLSIDVVAGRPREVALFESHPFTIKVANSGRNIVNALAVVLDYADDIGTLESLSAPNDINGNPTWTCTLGDATCIAVGGVSPGGEKATITARLSFATPGTRSLSAVAIETVSGLYDLDLSNNSDSDSTVVLPSGSIFASGFED